MRIPFPARLQTWLLPGGRSLADRSAAVSGGLTRLLESEPCAVLADDKRNALKASLVAVDHALLRYNGYKAQRASGLVASSDCSYRRAVDRELFIIRHEASRLLPELIEAARKCVDIPEHENMDAERYGNFHLLSSGIQKVRNLAGWSFFARLGGHEQAISPKSAARNEPVERSR